MKIPKGTHKNKRPDVMHNLTIVKVGKKWECRMRTTHCADFHAWKMCVAIYRQGWTLLSGL